MSTLTKIFKKIVKNDIGESNTILLNIVLSIELKK